MCCFQSYVMRLKRNNEGSSISSFHLHIIDQQYVPVFASRLSLLRTFGEITKTLGIFGKMGINLVILQFVLPFWAKFTIRNPKDQQQKLKIHLMHFNVPCNNKMQEADIPNLMAQVVGMLCFEVRGLGFKSPNQLSRVGNRALWPLGVIWP
jgi:hypothetical protein